MGLAATTTPTNATDATDALGDVHEKFAAAGDFNAAPACVRDGVSHGPALKPAGAAPNVPADARRRSPRYCCVPTTRIVYVVDAAYDVGSVSVQAVDRGACVHMLGDRYDGAAMLHAANGAPDEFAAQSGAQLTTNTRSNTIIVRPVAFESSSVYCCVSPAAICCIVNGSFTNDCTESTDFAILLKISVRFCLFFFFSVFLLHFHVFQTIDIDFLQCNHTQHHAHTLAPTAATPSQTNSTATPSATMCAMQPLTWCTTHGVQCQTTPLCSDRAETTRRALRQHCRQSATAAMRSESHPLCLCWQQSELSNCTSHNLHQTSTLAGTRSSFFTW